MSRRPNILLLFSDQHRADVLGCEEHPDVSTPNLDALAVAGTRFTRAYCQDGVCVPSRCSMLSGLYPRTLGCLDNGDRSLVMDEVLPLQVALRNNGYRTAAFGKRHVFQGCDAGWDITRSHLPNESRRNYLTWIAAQGHRRTFARDWAAEWGDSHPEGPPEAVDFAPAPLSAQPTQLSAELTMEAYTTRHTLDFLDDCAHGDTPFFCWATFYRPHQPYTPLPSYLARFDTSHWGAGSRTNDGIAKPPAFDQPPEELPPMLRSRRAATGEPWCLGRAHDEEQIFRDAIAAYYAGVLEIDDCIGRILAKLDGRGLRGDTIVIYAADHGEFAGGHGIMEKIAQGHNIYEETLRVPLIISWPGHLQQGQVSTDLVELVDLYPTLMSLCGVTFPDREHALAGRDLTAHLASGERVDRDCAISENWSQVAVIGERYKLGHWLDCSIDPARDFRDHGDLLFDRQNDPAELQNVIDEPACASVRAELTEHYHAWAAAIPAPGKHQRAQREASVWG